VIRIFLSSNYSDFIRVTYFLLHCYLRVFCVPIQCIGITLLHHFQFVKFVLIRVGSNCFQISLIRLISGHSSFCAFCALSGYSKIKKPTAFQQPALKIYITFCYGVTGSCATQCPMNQKSPVGIVNVYD
jgi:hypothetical protein